MFQVRADGSHRSRDARHSAQCRRGQTSRTDTAEPERLEKRHFHRLVSTTYGPRARRNLQRTLFLLSFHRRFIMQLFAPSKGHLWIQYLKMACKCRSFPAWYDLLLYWFCWPLPCTNLYCWNSPVYFSGSIILSLLFVKKVCRCVATDATLSDSNI
jgi:hypothetical protein